jgi:hypothetical protein
MSLHRTLLDTMKGSTTDEATTGTKEEIHVVRRETREGVECKAIHSDMDGSRETEHL